MSADGADIALALGQSELLAGLPPAALTALAGRVHHRSVAAGSYLCHAGQEGTSAFLVVSGRFRAEAAGEEVGEIGRGELVGEVSLLTGEPRSADVIANRDSEVVELPADVFTDVLASHPECYQVVSRQLVGRLQRLLTTPGVKTRAAVIAVLHTGSARVRATAAAFVGQLAGHVVVVESQDVDLNALETHNDLVVILAGPDNEALWKWAVRQGDDIVLFADGAMAPAGLAVPTIDAPFELVLVHPPTLVCPVGTAQWLDVLKPTSHHHVRADNDADLGRMKRRLNNDENILVLSGGGARGLAHAGLYRALFEAGVAVDAVVGVSAGAIGAALIGLDHQPKAAGAIATRLFSEGGSPINLTVPTVAMSSGSRMNERLKELCGEHTQIEDLWLPALFVSTNLTTAGLHLHERGPLWRALRASTAIPGVFPPVAEPSGLLVDGGLVANLPVEIVRRRRPGATVIASDVSKKMRLLPDDFPEDAEVSGWEAVRSRLGRSGGKLPGMVRILAQLTALGNGGEAQGDLHFEFDLDDFGMFDFKRGAEIVDVGYEQSLEPVAAWVGSRR